MPRKYLRRYESYRSCSSSTRSLPLKLSRKLGLQTFQAGFHYRLGLDSSMGDPCGLSPEMNGRSCESHDCASHLRMIIHKATLQYSTAATHSHGNKILYTQYN